MYPGKIMTATETGYSTSAEAGGCPAWFVEGKYMERLLFAYWLHGNINRVYPYEFIDETVVTSDPNNLENHYGLLDINGNPKPAFTALKNLISLFSDPGSTFSCGSLDWSMANVPAGFQHVLYQKRNGAYYLVVWNEITSTDTLVSQTATLTVNSAAGNSPAAATQTRILRIAAYNIAADFPHAMPPPVGPDGKPIGP